MRGFQKPVVGLVATLFGFAWLQVANAAPAMAGDNLASVGKVGGKYYSEERATPRKKKKKKKKSNDKKEEKKATAGREVLPYAVGLKLGLMPFSDMNAKCPTQNGMFTEYDYDFRIMWSWGGDSPVPTDKECALGGGD